MVKIPDDIIESVNKFRDSVTSIINIEKIFLYGSYAKGNYDSSSDIDVCIIAKESRNPCLLSREITRKIIYTDIRIEPVVFLSEDFYEDEPRGLLREIKEHGVEINF